MQLSIILQYLGKHMHNSSFHCIAIQYVEKLRPATASRRQNHRSRAFVEQVAEAGTELTVECSLVSMQLLRQNRELQDTYIV
jgi:hypothetical protein